MLLQMLPPSPNAPAHCVLTCMVVEQMPNTLLTEQMKMCNNSRMGQFNRHEYVHLLAVTTHCTKLVQWQPTTAVSLFAA